MTVSVLSPGSTSSGDWRLEARRSDGYLVVTSRPYPTYPSADGALDFVGSLSALAGDPQRTGRVEDTTQPDDRICDCRSLRQACLHFEVDAPDHRGRGVPEQPTTAPVYPSLTVQPDNGAEWGWTLMVRQPDGEPVATSGRYLSESDAAAACDFAAGLVSGRF